MDPNAVVHPLHQRLLMTIEEVLIPLDRPAGVPQDDLQLLLVAALVDQDGGRAVSQVMQPQPRR